VNVPIVKLSINWRDIYADADQTELMKNGCENTRRDEDAMKIDENDWAQIKVVSRKAWITSWLSEKTGNYRWKISIAYWKYPTVHVTTL
jgi:hypothetical protein